MIKPTQTGADTGTEAGILAFGAYIPRRRLQRAAIHQTNAWYEPSLRGAAKGEKSIGNWDEDPITMAVEAARDCLSGFDRSVVGSLHLASTTLPNADRLNAGVVKEALTLGDDLDAADITGSQRAGTTALARALSGQSTGLVIAAEQRVARAASAAEMFIGDGSAAVLVGQGDCIAKSIARHNVTVDFVDHFRAVGERFDYDWEARWIRDEGFLKIAAGAVGRTLESHGLDPVSIDHAAIGIAARGVPQKIAKIAGLNPDAIVNDQIATIGHTGTAYPLMLLVAALERAQPGEKILVLGFGQGADVMVFEVTDAIASLPERMGVSGWLGEGVKDDNYQRYLFHRGLLETEKGMRAEGDQKQPGTTLYRQRKAVMGLVGGKCSKTGTVQFPKSDVSVNQNDRAQGTQEDHPMAELPVQIVTYTADRLSFSPDPPTYYGNVDFEGGGRLTAEFTDVTAADVSVGAEMRMVFRIKAKDQQRGFTKYFWKAAPSTKLSRKGVS